MSNSKHVKSQNRSQRIKSYEEHTKNKLLLRTYKEEIVTTYKEKILTKKIQRTKCYKERTVTKNKQSQRTKVHQRRQTVGMESDEEEVMDHWNQTNSNPLRSKRWRSQKGIWTPKSAESERSDAATLKSGTCCLAQKNYAGSGPLNYFVYFVPRPCQLHIRNNERSGVDEHVHQEEIKRSGASVLDP